MGRIASKAAGEGGVVRLSLSQIAEDPAFDVREVKLCREQVDAILQGLRNGVDVEPPSVWQDTADGRYRVVDGWHRLAALADWKEGEPVPVRVLEASRRAAAAEAMRRRSIGSVTLTKAERMDGAWRMVRMPAEGNEAWAYSKSETARACGVSERLVANMRHRLAAMVETGQVPTGDWGLDRSERYSGGGAEMTDKEREAMTAAVAKAVNAALVGFRRKDDDALLTGIAEGMGVHLLGKFRDFIFEGEDEAYDHTWSGHDPASESEADSAF